MLKTRLRRRWMAAVVLFGFSVSLAGAGETLPAPFKVIPQLQKVEMLKGEGLKFGALKSVQLKGSFPRPITGPILSSLPQADGKEGVLSLQLVETPAVPTSPEGYVMTISSGTVEILARGDAGLFYGCQTLEQLLEDARDLVATVPACKITDAPVMSYRAIQIDVRHHLDNMEYYYRTIDRLARYKINAVVFEIEDKLRFRSQPLISAPQAFTIEEMAALTNYARDRHIEITPLVQSLGHVSYILKHPEYAHLREDPKSAWVFCPSNEETYKVIFDMCRDAIQATPGSRYLHFGGDETGAIGKCARCKAFVDKEGMLGLNLYWFNKVNEFARKNGRVAIFWDDMIFEHSGLYTSVHDPAATLEVANKEWKKGRSLLDTNSGKFPRDVYYMRWDYSMARQPGNIMALDWYKQSGLNVMICTAASDISPLYPRACQTPKVHTTEFYDDRVQTIISFVQLAVEKGIDKHLCSAWDDASPHMETYWRGLVASAEYGWAPFGRSQQEYEEAFWQREFGPECTGATGLYAELFKAAEFWSWGFFTKGNREMTSPAEKEKNIIGLPDRKSPGAWTKANAERLQVAAQELTRYENTSRQLAELAKKARRNRYHFEILTATNDFQIGSAKLLTALLQCDVADKAARTTGANAVRAALEYSDKVWENLKAVYGKTRFYGNPPGFVTPKFLSTWPDRPDFAEQRGDLSFLIMPEETYHRKIQDWLKGSGD
jgi:hexosaminidase